MLPDYALIESIKRGQRDRMAQAYSDGADVSQRDFNGKSPLEVAMDRGEIAMARELIRLGANVDQPIGKRGEVILHRAARTGDFGFVALLLELGAKPNPVNAAGKTPLHLAAAKGFQYMADELLRGGASVMEQTAQGDCPLHLAARRGDLSTIKTLMNAGADPTATNNTGYTSLHEAAAAGKTEAVKLLLDKAQLGPHSKSVLLPRVRHAAELHGQSETAAALLAAEGRMALVAESPTR